jgi:DNA-binding HxlR family transcriptional regulator
MDGPSTSFSACAEAHKAAAEDGVELGCPVRDVMHGLSGKWVPFVLKALDERPYRFGELRRLLPDVTQRMLTQTLRDLQRDGLVSRTVLPTNPPSTEYALTPLGASLCGELRALFRWAAVNGAVVQAARLAFDQNT